MQNTTMKNDYILFSIPKELLDEIELDPMDVVQMSVADGRLIIEKADAEDYVCDGDCENCPFGNTDCNRDCGNCPGKNECDDFDDSFHCRISESCDECPYCCPNCGDCLYDFDGGDDDYE